MQYSMIDIILYSAAAGACIPVGGMLARVERIQPAWLERELRHFIIAFGGGVLIAAVALVLVPEGVRYVGAGHWVALFLMAGGLVFFGVERWMASRRSEAPQLSAMLLDYVPESLALGGVLAAGAASGPLLALFIGLQNLPEGFNAYRELRATRKLDSRRVLMVMFALVPLGPLLGLSGWVFLVDHRAVLGAIMLFASGGILYLIFQDIAPQSRLHRHWAPPLGAVCGFTFALLGQLWAGVD